ncbi:MAG: hypothetical protein ACK5CA_09810 [Cyanobacteriota bacterium]
MNYLFGESSQIVYEAKSTFVFHFYLEVKKQDKIYPYAFEIFDYCNCVECSFYRCSHEETKPTSSLEKPNEAEFSADEIDKFIFYFLGYLLGYFQLVKEEVISFERVIPSNSYVYGYSKEKGFFEYEKEYEEQEYED